MRNPAKTRAARDRGLASEAATPLKVLVLDDQPAAAERLVDELRAAGFAPDVTRVETEGGFLAHLDPTVELVLAGVETPGFVAREALRRLRERGLDLPVIVIADESGEVEALARI